MAAGGAGSFPVLTAPTPFEILAAPNGAWPSWDHAFYNAVTGSSLFGLVSSSGSVRIGEYDGSGSSTQIGVLLGDQHNAPAVIRRSSDGRYIAVMSEHGGAAMYVAIATNANDNDPWADTFHIEDELGGGTYTYPFLAQLDDETSDPIYLIFRDATSSSTWRYSKSTSAGVNGSWAAATTITSGTRYYMRASKSSGSRIDFALCAGSYAEDFASIYHFYYDGGWFASDGTSMGSPPFTTGDMTLVYDGSTSGARIPNSIYRVGSDIAITFPVYTGTPSGHIGTDGDYVYARWDGSAWTSHIIAASIGMTDLDFSEGGIVIDPSDLDTVVLSKRGAGGTGTWRIWEYRTTDDGASWSSVQVTSSGDEDRYPWFIIDHTPALRYIWQKGTFTTEDDFDVGVWGAGT